MNYIGDYVSGASVMIYFNTFDSNDPSASVTVTDLAVGDIHIHRDDDLTQRASTAGYTLDIDVDGIAGCHLIKIDTSDNTTADFYIPGHDYGVRLEGITVDAATLNPFVAHFSIENRYTAGLMARSNIATLASQTSFTLSTGEASGDDDAYNGCVAVITDISTRDQKCVGYISDYTGATRTVTLAADPGIFTMAVGDHVAITAGANVAAWLGNAVTASAGLPDVNVETIDDIDAPATWKTSVNAEVDTALLDIHLDHLLAADYDPAAKPGTATALLNELVENDGGVSRFTSNALDEVWADNTPPNGADIASILTDTAEIGAAGAGLTAVPWNAAWDAEVESEVNDALVVQKLDHLVAVADADDAVDNSIVAKIASATGDWSTFSATTDALEALRDRGDAAWITGAGGSDRLLLADTTIATLASQTSFTLTAGSTDDDAYNGCTIVIEDVSTSVQKAIGVVDDYTGATKTVTLLEDPGIFTIATTDKVYILAEKSLKPTTAANYHVDITSGGAVGIDWGNVENPTTALDLSGTDIQLCDTVTTLTGHTAQTGDSFARIGAAGAGLTAIDLPNQTMDITGDITGNLSGSVGSVTAEVSADVAKINASAAAASNLALSAATIVTGSVETSGSNSTTQVQTDLAEATDDHYNGRVIIFTSGAVQNQATDITSYTGSTGVLEFTALTETPADAVTFVIV